MHEFYGMAPPLATEVFRAGTRFPRSSGVDQAGPFKDLLDFIASKSGIPVSSIGRADISIEDCFDWTVDAIKTAREQGGEEEITRCERRRLTLLAYFCGVISEFRAESSPWLYDLAGAIWRDQADVLTFNYDTLLESALAIVSGRIPQTPEDERIEESWRAFNSTGENRPEIDLNFRGTEWEPHTRYWVPFDRFELPQPAGNTAETSGAYFETNPSRFREPKFLKLHGSVDWFRYTNLPYGPFEPLPQAERDGLAGKLLFNQWKWQTPAGAFLDWPHDHHVLLDPVLATGSGKGEYLETEPLASLWRLAAESLKQCERLVVIGFSFAASDQPARKLVKECIDRAVLKEAIWVQPSTRHAVDRARELDIRQDARFPTVIDYLRDYYVGSGSWHFSAVR
jgi:hypothetical protein